MTTVQQLGRARRPSSRPASDTLSPVGRTLSRSRTGVPIDPSVLLSRSGTSYGTFAGVTGLKIGYAPISTVGQDLTAQRNSLVALGVDTERFYVDHGLSGTTRIRPGLREAPAACRAGDTLVVSKLDRLARSLTDAREIVEELGFDDEPTQPAPTPTDSRLNSTCPPSTGASRRATKRSGMTAHSAGGHSRVLGRPAIGAPPRNCRTRVPPSRA